MLIVPVCALFAAVIAWRGGSFPAVSPARTRWVLLQVGVAFAAEFAAGAWRNALYGMGSPQPITALAADVVPVVSLAIPLILQLGFMRGSLAELGIGPNRDWRSTLVLLGWLLLFVVATVIYRVTQQLPMTAHWERVPRYAAGLFAEEMLFRGFIQTRFERLYGTRLGWLPASLLFALAHASRLLYQPASVALPEVTEVFALGALWGLAFAKTRSLFVVWPVHVVYDLSAGLLF